MFLFYDARVLLVYLHSAETPRNEQKKKKALVDIAATKEEVFKEL